MADPNPFDIGFPLGGVNKATGFADQPPGTTPSALNVWAYHYPGGRMRGGVRPGLTSAGFPGATPYNWCRASWVANDGIAVTTSAGTYVTTDGSTWNLRIATAPASVFSSCAALNGVLYQASSALLKVRKYPLLAGPAADLNVTNYADGTPKGVVPSFCGLVAEHGGGLYLAGDTNNPQVLYRSAINDPTDMDFSAVDEGAAWASSGVTGQINKPIIALLSHGNGCLLVGHTDAMTVIRGDPQIAGAGAIEEIDAFAGPVMQSAWCKTGNDDTAILTREEFSIMASGCGTPRITLSRFKLPDELAAVDPGKGDIASVAYDGRWGGVLIFISRYNGATYDYTQFFFDLASKGFMPMEFASGEFRLGVTMAKKISRTRGACIALKSGGGSYFDTTSTESINSHVFIGPIPLGNAILDGILSRIAFVLSEDSDPVDFEIYSGSSQQEAFNSAVRFSGTLSRQGLSYSHHPRLVDNTAWVKLKATGTARWAIERVVGETYPVRRRRVMRNAP